MLIMLLSLFNQHYLQIKQHGERKLPSVFMRYILIIILLVLGGCAPLRHYPEGVMGDITPYYTDGSFTKVCHMCGENTTLFKKDSKGRIICNVCYRTKVKY